MARKTRKKRKVKRAVKYDSKEKYKIPKIKTGIPGFDKLLREGIPKGSSILVEGGPGSGKTLFCLQILYNLVKRGMKGLYMSFEEPAWRLKSHMYSFGWDPDKYEKKGLLMIRNFNALDIARSVEALLSEAKKELLIEVQPVLIPKDFIPEILVIDSLSAIASAFSGEESRFRIYMEQLFKYLERHNTTSLLIREVSNPTHIGNVYVEKGEAVSFLSDGIIVIYNVIYDNGRRGRAVEILKLRGESFDRRIVVGEITSKGWVIYPNKTLQGSFRLRLT